MRIYKYPLAITDVRDGVFTGTIQMPLNANIIKVGMQGTVITLWAMFEDVAWDSSPTEPRSFLAVGTGRDFYDGEANNGKGLEYLDSVFDRDYVWHVFEQTT